jgi:hypothetical protein
MSFETKLLQYCNHRVLDEDHVVDTDNVTVYLDQNVANTQNVNVKINSISWPSNNQTEILYSQDVSSQITGSNSIFNVSNIPMYDGSNRRKLATRLVDAAVQVFVTSDYPEDASAQFTGADVLLVTQHRPLLSKYNIFADQLHFSTPASLTDDIIVTVNSSLANIVSIEPVYGKIILETAPPVSSTVKVSYNYKAKVTVLSAQTGQVTIKETPSINQQVVIYYFYLANDGWTVGYSSNTKNSTIVFDRQKQTNQFVIVDENVSSQFTELENSFVTKFKPIIKPRAGLRVLPSETMITDIFVSINGISVTPMNIDAQNGIVYLGVFPKMTDVVLTSYNYRGDNSADIISVDYQVVQNNCRKCKTTGQVNDFGYDRLGLLTTVMTEKKMLQDLLKIVMAIKGSNTANPWYGTSLVSYIGTAKLSDYYTVKFKGEIITAGANMKNLQQQQTQYQQVDDQEFFSFLDGIIVEQSNVDPDFYDIAATVVSQASTAMPLTTTLKFNNPLLKNPLLT